MSIRGISISEAIDVVNTTLPHFKNRGKFETAFQYQSYFALDEVFKQDRYQVQDGSSIEWTVVLDGNGSARHTRLYGSSEYNQVDVTKLATQRWCFAEATVMYEARELLMNRGSSQKAKYIKTRYFAAYKDLADEIEQRFVLTPENSTDDVNPHGLLWWIAMTDAGVVNYDGDFIGRTARYADGTTTTVRGGIDSATEDMWRNWACNHTGINLDTMESIRRGLLYTDFQPPSTVKEMVNGPAAKRRILWSISYQAEYMRLVNSGPDNRNGDLSPFKGSVTFMGVRTVGLATLEDVAYSPIVCPDFSHFYPVVHSDWWMREDEPMRDPYQRHVIKQGIDCWYNYMCDNIRHGGFMLNKPIPA